MEELIKEAFLGFEIIGHRVIDGHYDLHGPDGEIILPQVWESVIEPGRYITMHMWPMPEAPPPEPTPPPPPPPPPAPKPAPAAEAVAAATIIAAEGKAAAAAKAKLQGTVKFRDAVGRKFSFPFELCRAWAVSFLLLRSPPPLLHC